MENFLSYTETDPNSKLTVTEPKVTAANLLRNEDAYVYKDFGSNYFDTLNIQFEMYISSATGTNGIGQMGLTVSVINDATGWGTSDIGVRGYRPTSSTQQIQLFRGNVASTTSDVSINTLYYCTLSRTAGSDTVILAIYSNPERTIIVDSISLSGYGTAKYRYLYGISSYNDGNSIRYDGYFQNFNIGGGDFFSVF